MSPPPGLISFAVPLACGIAIGWSINQWQQPALAPPMPKGAESRRAETGALAPIAQASPPGSFEAVQAEAGWLEVDASNIARAVRGALSLVEPIEVLVRLREIVRSLSVDEIPAAIEQIRQLPPNEQWPFIDALGARWAELDLEGALETCQANRGDSRYLGLLAGVVQKWALTEPQAALAWLKGLPPGQQQHLREKVGRALSRSNPAAAFELLQSPGHEQENGTLAEHLFSEWYMRDRSAALAAFSQLKGNLSARAVWGLAQVMANEDPAGAAAWANSLPDKRVRSTAITQVALQWSSIDPAAALEWGRSLNDEELRTRAIGPAIRMLAMRDLSATKAALDSLSPGQEKETAMMWVVNALSETDNTSALELLSTLPDSPARREAFSRVCASWAAEEPEAAMDWLFQNGDPRAEDANIRNVLANWSQRDPNQVSAWVNRITDPDKREIAISNLVAGIASSAPDKAKEFFASISPESQGTAAKYLTHVLASQDLESARVWAEGLPSGPGQNTAWGIIASQLALKDPTAAAQWIQKLPVGMSRDKAVAGFAERIFNRDPEGALEWAVTISDPAERSRALRDLSVHWITYDAAKARKWIQESRNLTPAERQRLLGR